MTLLQTARLRLREMTRDDAVFLHEIMNEPEFIANVADRGIRSPAEAERWMAEKILPSYAQHGFGFYVVELQETGEAVGFCGFVKRESLDDVEIGYAMLRRHSGKGYTYEAAAAVFAYGRETLRLPRIIAVTSSSNAVSIHLLKKLGLRFERMVQLPEFEHPLMLFG
jgi:[ribosomal protein S5]-alanine N-acetyltransferase